MEGMEESRGTRQLTQFTVIHVIHNQDDGEKEIPTLLLGEAKKPVSGLGSNASNASIATSGRHPVPQAVIMGGKFDQDELTTLRSLPGAERVPWLRADPEEVKTRMQAGGPPPTASEVAERAKKCLEAHGLVPGSPERQSVGEIWDY